MTVRNSLPFEFPFRWNELRRLFAGLPDEAADFLDQRDRDIEDFLASLDDDVSGVATESHLLAMSASGASVASGGAYITFGSIVAQNGFSSVTSASGEWTHPVSGVYLLTYEHAWDSYTGGGVVALELDGVEVPEGVISDGSSAGQEGRGTIAYVAEPGQVGKIKVTQASGSAQTCDALVRVAITDPKASSSSSSPASSNVVSLGPQDDPDVSSYTAGGAAWNDPDAKWIWHTAPVGGERPVNEEGWFEGEFSSTTAVAATVEYSCDNECAVYLNGSLLGTQTGLASHWTNRYTASATLQAGSNMFEVYGKNLTGGPGDNAAAFILSVHDSSGTVLFRTSDVTGWTGYTAEPVGWLS